MAPLTRRRKTALAAAPPAPVIDPADRISKLPEEIQAQILSFLPAQEAVRTCVLARTWHHVWKFTRRLLITGDSVQEVREFVDRLLINFAGIYFQKGFEVVCPTFSMLKTLVLTQVYRCEPVDCSVLECMLEHAPLLEKLTLTLKKELQDGKYKVEIKGYPDAKVKSTKISQHLQIVKIICEDVNGIFVNVLNFLGTLNICFETRVTKK